MAGYSGVSRVRKLAIFGLFWAWGASLGSCSRASRAPTDSIPELQALRGKPVIVHFWASWCPPCLPELPQIIEFAERVKSAGWTVLAVSTDSKPEAALAALPKGTVKSPGKAAEKGQDLPSNFRVVFDSESKAATAFGSFVYPETYWVDEGGRIRHKWVGPQDWTQIAGSGFLGAKF